MAAVYADDERNGYPANHPPPPAYDDQASEDDPLLDITVDRRSQEVDAPVGACHPAGRGYRFLVLVLICLTSLGSYFCYDNPAALQTEVKKDMMVDTTNFMILYSVYSWPNVIVCFFGGYLIDRVLGVRLGAIIFGLFLLVGHYIFAVGAFVNKFWVMILGRVIFGLGGENLQVATNAYAVNWFKGSQLNLVMGLGLSVSRAGSVLNMNIMEPIYNALKHDYAGHICLGLTLFIGGLTLVFSQYCTFHLAWLDRNAERKLKLTDRLAAGDKISLRDIKDFPPSLWLLSIICVGYYTAIFPFIGLGLVYFESKFDLDPAQAKIVNSLIYTISAFASPAFGFMIDKTGRNLTWTLVAVLSTMCGHALLAFTWLTPYVAVCLMGLSYSMLASSLWPMVALVVKENQLGTAYGIMQAVQNLGLAIFSIVVGLIVDSTGYLVLEVFFLGLLCVSLLAGVVLYLYDAKVDGPLNLSVPQAKARADRTRLATTVGIAKEKEVLS